MSKRVEAKGSALSPCCIPARAQGRRGEAASPPPVARSAKPVPHHWRRVPGAAFLMGSSAETDFPEDGEGPVRRVVVSSFSISAYAVTNRQFAEFIRATGYVTDAERLNWSFVFDAFVADARRQRIPRVPAETPWWLPVSHAYWAQPEGPGSTVLGRVDHPVVHVSWNDAKAYCAWSGTHLPTEAEWEYAARGGVEQKIFPWGDCLTPDGEHCCNVWQGRFPTHNTAEDGYVGTAPVNAYAPNGYGLYNVAGNVWEWCEDYFSPTYHRDTAELDPVNAVPSGSRSLRGGSYLCHESYCNRYRVAARNSNAPDASTGNIGFRVVVRT